MSLAAAGIMAGSSVLSGAMGMSSSRKARDASNNRLVADMRMWVYGQQFAGEMMDFNQDQLDDWESKFGGLEENLNTYYNNLDPTKFATQNKQAYGEALDKQMTQLNESLASRGMQSAGMRVQAEKEAAFAKAAGFAQADIDAPEQVRGMQAAWLGANQADKVNAISGINNAYGAKIGSNVNMSGNISRSYGDIANMRNQSSQGWMGMAGNLAGSAISMGIRGMDNLSSGSFASVPGEQEGTYVQDWDA